MIICQCTGASERLDAHAQGACIVVGSCGGCSAILRQLREKRPDLKVTTVATRPKPVTTSG